RRVAGVERGADQQAGSDRDADAVGRPPPVDLVGVGAEGAPAPPLDEARRPGGLRRVLHRRTLPQVAARAGPRRAGVSAPQVGSGVADTAVQLPPVVTLDPLFDAAGAAAMVELCERFGRYRMYGEHEQLGTDLGRGCSNATTAS